jgi:hypothetical protein
MSDVEFLDPGPYQPDEPEPAPPPAPVADRDTLVALGLLAASAVLAVVAAFRTFFTARAAAAGYSVDAFGRYSADSTVPGGIHGVRFGIPLCLCAAGFAMLTLLVASSVLPSVRPRFTDRGASWIAGGALFLAGGLGGTVLAMWLEAQSLTDSIQTEGLVGLQLTTGAAVWVALAGFVVALAAVVAALRLRLAWYVPDEPDVPDDPDDPHGVDPLFD